jgi:hypothetical protein
MTKDILSEYGPDSPDTEKPRATSGGPTMAKELPYSPPKGPSSQMQFGPGLHGSNLMCGTQGKH